MILLVDNYDSFTWNLYQAVAGLGVGVSVVRNDALSVEGLLALEPAGVLLSPGPGHPRDAGCCLELLERLPGHLPLLGVCLGHQALVLSEGGTLEFDPEPVHGKASSIHHDDSRLFRDLPNPLVAGRYHSIRASRAGLPATLRLTAWTEEGWVMGVEHTHLPRFGVQFHPESILSPCGGRLLVRFLEVVAESSPSR